MAQITQRSFTGGELAPALRSRADLSKYTSGLALCENMFIRAQGGAYSRPGTRFIGEADDSNNQVRLIPFSFNTEQTYILVFQENTLQFISNGSFVESGGSRVTVATPYLGSELSRLKFTQDADVMTLVHHNHPPMDLKRLSNTSWTLTPVEFSTPVEPVTNVGGSISIQVTGVSVNDQFSLSIITGTSTSVTKIGDEIRFNDSWTGADGTIQNVLSGNYFTISGKNGSTELILSTSFDTTGLTDNGTYGNLNYYNVQTIGTGTGDSVRNYSYTITAVDKEGRESPRSVIGYIKGIQSLSSTFGVSIHTTAKPSHKQTIDFYRVYKSLDDAKQFGWIADLKYDNQVTMSYEDFNIAPDYSDAPPEERTPFDTDYPNAVTYYQQRKVYANTLDKPQTIYTSRTGYYDDFRTSNPLRDDDALTFTINSNRVNEIRHLLSLDALIPLTSGGEWLISEGQDQVLIPSTVGARIQSYNGSSWVEPAIIDNTAIYVQEKGSRVRDLRYAVSDAIYQGNDLSIMSEHLFEGHTITEMSYADEPYGILWCVRDDGVLLGMTYQREQNVWAWHQHNTDGLYESIATISEDGRDASYVCVNRTIGGVTKRYIERIEKRITSDAADCFYVDSGLSYDGAATNTFSGLDHLEGKTVVALADGFVVKNLTVTGGSVTLDDDYSKVHIGLPYTSKIQTLDIDIPSMQQSLNGKRVNIPTLYISVEKSRSIFAGVNGEELQEVTPREVSYDYEASPLNTWVEELNISPRWSDGRSTGTSGIVIEQPDPLPLTILSVTAEVDISG